MAKVFNKLLPMPMHSLMLLIVWLLLNDFSVGHLVLGSFLAWLIPVLTFPYVDDQSKARKPVKIVVYFLRLVRDIIQSNIEVALRVMYPNRTLQPGIVAYPLSMKAEFPLTVLASSVSLTPGTVSVEFSDDRRWLYIHVLHLQDEQKLISEMTIEELLPMRKDGAGYRFSGILKGTLVEACKRFGLDTNFVSRGSN